MTPEQRNSTQRAAYYANCEHHNKVPQQPDNSLNFFGNTCTAHCRPATSWSSMRLPSVRCIYVDDSSEVELIYLTFDFYIATAFAILLGP
jgi:hypothetical protein